MAVILAAKPVAVSNTNITMMQISLRKIIRLFFLTQEPAWIFRWKIKFGLTQSFRME